MANKAISELPQAQNVNNQDLFVLEQSGIAKKLTAETFITEQGIIDALAEALDGHGGIQSVTLASVSGRIRTYRITFSDGSATTFQVYDGTSIDRISRTSSSGLDDVYTIFLSDGTTTFFTVHNGADGNVSEAMLNDALKDKAPAVTETTESSAIANFTDGADDMVMHNIVAEIVPVQSGSGDPSPSNIRPISGWTGCNVTRAGKNLFDSSVFLTATGWTETNGVYSGPCSSIQYSTIGYLLELPNLTEQITMSFKGYVDYANSRAGYFRIYYSDGTTSNVELIDQTWKNYSLTSTAGKVVVGIGFLRSNLRDISITDFQVEIGLSASAYESYHYTSLTVDWSTEAGTVYGGTIDVATGLLTVDRAMVDMGTLTWSKVESSNYRTFRGTLNNIIYFYNETTVMSSAYVGTNGQNADASADNYVWTDGVSSVSIKDTSKAGMSASEFKTAMNGVQLCYELKTPQTYQLTPQEVKTLLGTNNVWADTGNVSVTYPADTKMFIEKLTMPTEDDLVANQAITSGKYFMVGNSLYLALANIASGAQITIGTNAQRVSLADALNTINS